MYKYWGPGLCRAGASFYRVLNTLPDRKLDGAGDTLLTTIGQANVDLRLRGIQINDWGKEASPWCPSDMQAWSYSWHPNYVQHQSCRMWTITWHKRKKIHSNLNIIFLLALARWRINMPTRLKDVWQHPEEHNCPYRNSKKRNQVYGQSWCHRGQLIGVPNRSSTKARWSCKNTVCLDLTKLNKEVCGSVPYAEGKGDTGQHTVAKDAVYSKHDANSSFHKVSRNRKSAKLTTYITPFERLMFRRFLMESPLHHSTFRIRWPHNLRA